MHWRNLSVAPPQTSPSLPFYPLKAHAVLWKIKRILLPQLLRVVFNLHYYNRMCFSCSSFHFQELDSLMVKMSPNFRDASTYHWILLP